MTPAGQVSWLLILLLLQYGHRTSPVRALSVVAGSFGPHTGHMAGEARATPFMTGAAGIIGSELVKVLLASGHRCLLSRSPRRRRSACVTPGRYPSSAICSSRVGGGTKQRLTGSSVFRIRHRRPADLRLVPRAAIRLVVGPVVAGCMQAEAVLSNIRLHGIGFRFRHPTLEQGLHQVLGALYE